MANVVIGSAQEIHSFLFGAAPSQKEAAMKALRQAWSSRRKVQAIAKAFGQAPRLAANDRAVRAAIQAIREAGA